VFTTTIGRRRRRATPGGTVRLRTRAAHSYRHKHHHDAADLVFDAGLGVYAVVDWPGYYWHIDHYLRWVSGEWSVSSRIDGVWVVVSGDRVPAKLVAKHAKHGKKARRHHKRGSAPAKHGH
jgi:hypothetical protein